MTIRVRHWGRPDTADFENLATGLSVLVLDLRLEEGHLAPAARFREEDPLLRQADLLVFRVATEPFVDQLRSRALGALIGDTPAVALFYDIESSQMKIAHLTDSRAERMPSMHDLRSADVGAHLRLSGGILDAGDDAHFRLPNGRHSQTFVRVAEALCDPVAVERLADWVMFKITDNTVLIVDTGTILSLCYAIRTRRMQQTPEAPQLSFVALNAYPIESSEIAAAIDMALAKNVEAAPLFLMSVNSSGGLFRVVDSQAPENMEFLVVCDTSETNLDADVLHSLPVSMLQPGEDGRCAECKERHAIYIDPRTYMPSANLRYTREALAWQLVESQKSFWEACQRTKAVFLHRDVETGDHRYRHYPVFIDIVALLSDESFRKTAKDALWALVESTPTIDVVVIPDHEASEALSELLSEVATEKGTSIGRTIHGRTPGPDDFAGLPHKPEILVLDDALIEGSTLLNLRSRAYEGTRVHDMDPEIQAFVVLARPKDDEALTTIRRRYTGRNGIRFASAFDLRLPPVRRSSCPWCAELALWKRWRSKLGAGTELAKLRLKELEQGLPSPLLMFGCPDDSVTLGAAIGSLDQPTAFAAFSAIGQQLKQRVVSPIGSGEIKVANTRHTLDCYFDAAFASAALRTFDRRQMRWIGQDPEVAEFVDRVDATAVHPSYAAELTLAAVTSKIPVPPVKALVQRLPESDLRELLLELIAIHGY